MTEQTDVDDGGASARSPGRAGAAAVPGRERVLGIDAARGLALLGMLAVHVFETLRSDQTPSHTQEYVAGHALATFVLLAGVSLTFATGRGRTRGSRRPDAATAVSLAVRGGLIGLLGLVINVTDPSVDVILPYYGAMFVLAVPLVRLGSRTLTAISASLVVLAPLIVLASFDTDLPTDEPTMTALLHPVQLAATLLVSGSYPAVEYMAFICLGLVLGRLDLSNTRIAARLAGGGALLAVAAWWGSSLLLFRLGGLEQLRDAAPSGLTAEQTSNVILWDPDTTTTWWWLAERAPYTVTPLRMLHDLGVATAVLGCCLLLTRVRRSVRLMRPLIAAGSMTLTLYTLHVLVLDTGVLDDHPITLYVVMVLGALALAVAWMRRHPRGPLEELVARCCRRARRAVERRAASRP